MKNQTLETPRRGKNTRILLYVWSLRFYALFLAAFTILCLAPTANADINKSGGYFAAIGGFNTLGDQDIDATIGGIRGSGSTSFSASYIAGFSVGYRFDNNWSVEEAFVFRRAELDSATIGQAGTFDSGAIENTQLSVKVLYHMPLSANQDFELYVGGGVAWLAELDFDVDTPEGEQAFEKDRLGFELHTGVRYHGWKHGFAGAGLRYLSVQDAVLPSPSISSDSVRLGYDPLSVVVELGWRF